MDKTLGIRPDKPGETLGGALYRAFLGPERIERHKKLMDRMTALGLSAEKKVELVGRAISAPEALLDLDLQLDRLEYLIEQLERACGT